MTAFDSLAIATLLLSVVTLWMTRSLWIATVAGTVVFGYVTGILHGPAALWLTVMAISSSRLRTASGWRRAGWLTLTAALGLLLGLHLLPGFANPIVIRDAILATDALPYTQYVNFDKTLAGVLFLGCSGWIPMRSKSDWSLALRRAIPVMAATVLVVMAASLAIGFVQFEPRWSPLFWIWAPINLLTTCVSEEAFFRGLIQAELTRTIAARHATTIAVIASAVLFGTSHIAGGWPYVMVSSLAGCGYAMAYQRTARLEMSILTHFALNAAHFLVFTYPQRM